MMMGDLIPNIDLIDTDEFVDKISYPGLIIIIGDIFQDILLSQIFNHSYIMIFL
jgi:hypothetical protein